VERVYEKQNEVQKPDEVCVIIEVASLKSMYHRREDAANKMKSEAAKERAETTAEKNFRSAVVRQVLKYLLLARDTRSEQTILGVGWLGNEVVLLEMPHQTGVVTQITGWIDMFGDEFPSKMEKIRRDFGFPDDMVQERD
jgi:hypothetical protein